MSGVGCLDIASHTSPTGRDSVHLTSAIFLVRSACSFPIVLSHQVMCSVKSEVTQTSASDFMTFVSPRLEGVATSCGQDLAITEFHSIIQKNIQKYKTVQTTILLHYGFNCFYMIQHPSK